MTKEEKERLGYSIVLVDVPMRMTTERRYEQQMISFIFGLLFLLHVQPAMESNKATRNHNVGNPLFNAKTYLFDASSFHCPCALNSGLPTLWFPVASEITDQLTDSTAVLLGTHTNIIYMLVAGHWRADHQPHYLSVVFARQRRSEDKRQTKRKTKTPNPLVLDRALSRCFVCWLVCLLVSCVFVCLSVCVCLFVRFLASWFVCVWLFVSLLACSVGLFVRERKRNQERDYSSWMYLSI